MKIPNASTLSANMNSKKFSFKLILLVILICISFSFSYHFVFDLVFPDSIYVAMKITRKFVTALKANDLEEAQKLIEAPEKKPQLINDMSVLTNEEAIINYDQLYICNSYREEEIWENFGVMYYRDTSTRFKIELVQDVDKSWRVHNFALISGFEPGPFGDCE